MKANDRRKILVILLLAVLSAAVYWRVAGHGFINMDDAMYVADNPHVQKGITVEGLFWAFGFADRAYWHPVSWLSHMLDCELFGLDPGMHHLVNVFYHIINATVLFLALNMMTGALWRSAFVAGMFAMHPVNVDTVAWIAERKNLVSTLFWMLTLLSYAWYVRRQTIFRYLSAFGLFILGILSKPMLVTLPFVLLLLDYWPLQRMPLGFGRIREDGGGKGLFSRRWLSAMARLVYEKLPFLAVALVAIHVSMISMHGHVDVISIDTVSMKLRLENAVVAYVHYLWKMLWPWNLTVYYPYPKSVPLAHVIFAGAAVAAVTVMILSKIRKYPYLAVGWLWYLGALVPVSGIIQAGLWPAIAERWMYVPGIGLFIMASWGVRDLLSRLESGRQLYRYASLAVIMLLALLTFRQAGFWKDDFTLFSHAVSVSERNSVAHGNLADWHLAQGSYDDAHNHYLEALEANPLDPHIHRNFAVALLRMGRYGESVHHFRIAAEKFAHDEDVLIGLGTALARLGDLSGAIGSFTRALDINPRNAQTHFKLAVVLGESGRIDKAVDHYREALRLEPGFEQAGKNLDHLLALYGQLDSAVALLRERLRDEPGNASLHYSLGGLHEKKGNYADAADAYRKFLSLNPDGVQAMERLAFIHSRENDLPSALFWLREMLKRDPGNPGIHYNIACVYARQGKADEALKWLGSAVEKGFSDRGLLESDQDLESLRATAQFRELVSRLGSEAPGGGTDE